MKVRDLSGGNQYIPIGSSEAVQIDAASETFVSI